MGYSALAPAIALGLICTAANAQDATLEHGGDVSGVWNHSPPDYMRGYSGWAFHREPPAMTSWAQERYDANQPTFGPRGVPATESNDPVYECYPPGTPRAYFHPFPMEIIQLPGRVVMLYEYHHIVRQIYTDGRAHRTDLPPLWVGDSIGHWEGDVLVVETVNLNDSTWIDREGLPHSGELRLVETFELVDENTLRIGFLFDDPVAFTETWEAERFYTRVDWDIEDFACMERNTSSVFDEFERQILEYEEEPGD
jgi:hypothetical protein